MTLTVTVATAAAASISLRDSRADFHDAAVSYVRQLAESSSFRAEEETTLPSSSSSSCPWVRELGIEGICFAAMFGLLWLVLLLTFDMVVFEIPTFLRYQKKGIPLTGTIVDRQRFGGGDPSGSGIGNSISNNTRNPHIQDHLHNSSSYYRIVVECHVDGETSRKTFTEMIPDGAKFPDDYAYHDIGKTVPCIILPGESPDSWRRRHHNGQCGSLCMTIFFLILWIPLLAWGIITFFLRHTTTTNDNISNSNNHCDGWKLSLAWFLECAILLTFPFWSQILCPRLCSYRRLRMQLQMGSQYSEVALSPNDGDGGDGQDHEQQQHDHQQQQENGTGGNGESAPSRGRGDDDGSSVGSNNPSSSAIELV